MIVRVLPRQCGKTTEMIRLAATEFLYIICANKRDCERVFRIAINDGLDIPFPLTWAEFVEHRYYGADINGFVIDNLDECVQSMTIVTIRAVTLTGHPELAMGGRPLQAPKLIRDKVPALMRSHGDEPVTRIAAPGEYRDLLRAKLLEEALEVTDASDAAGVLAEAGDVLEVLLTLLSDLGLTWEQVLAARERKLQARGGFASRIVWYDDGKDTSAPGYEHEERP